MTLEKEVYSAAKMILSSGNIVISILLVLCLCMTAQAQNLIDNGDFDTPIGGGSYHKPTCAPGPWCNTDPLNQGGDCGIGIGDYTGSLGPSPGSGGQCCLVGQVDNTSHNEMYQTLSETFEAGMRYTLLFDMHDNGIDPDYWAVSVRGATSGIEVLRADQDTNPEIAGGGQWFTVAAVGVAGADVYGEQIEVYVGPRDGSGFLAYDSFRLTAEPASAPYVYDLTVDQSQSQLTFTVALTSGFGGDSDSDTSDIVGSMKVNLTPESGPFNGSRVTEIIWNMVDTHIELSVTAIWYILPIAVDIEGNNLGLRMGPSFAGSVAGGFSDVSYPGGMFNQTGNAVKGTGTVTYSAGVFGSGSVILDGEDPFAADFHGSVVDNGSTVSLTLPMDVIRDLENDGVPMGTVRIHGQVVGTANTHTSKSYLASDINTDDEVNLEDFALLVEQWQRISCDPDDDWCDGGDINRNGYVNMFDLDELAVEWLDITGQ